MPVDYFANNFNLMPNSTSVSDVLALDKAKYNPGGLVNDLLTDIVKFRQDDRANNVKDIIGRTIASGGSLADANNLVDAMGYSVNDKARAKMQEFANTAMAEQRKAQEHPLNLALTKARIAGQEATTQSTIDSNRRAEEKLPYEIANTQSVTRLNHANASGKELDNYHSKVEWDEDRDMQDMLFYLTTTAKKDPVYLKYLLKDPKVIAYMDKNPTFAKSITAMVGAYPGDLSDPVDFRPEQIEAARNFKPETLVTQADSYERAIQSYEQWRKLNGLDKDFGDGVDAVTKAAEYLLPKGIPKEDLNNARMKLVETLNEGLNYLDALWGDKAASIGDDAKLNFVTRAMERNGWSYVPGAIDEYKINKTILESLANSLGEDYLQKLYLGQRLSKHKDAILNRRDTLAKYQTAREAGAKTIKERRKEGIISEEDLKRMQVDQQLQLMKAFAPLTNAISFMQENKLPIDMYFK